MKKKFAITTKRLTEIEKLRGYVAPPTRYFKTRAEFDIAVGKDFIAHANKGTANGERFLVGLSHGQSPAGAYQYILDHYDEIENAHLLRYTFVNTPLKRQRGLSDIMNAASFLKRMLRLGLIDKDQILGRSLDRKDLAEYAEGFNKKLAAFLEQIGKDGLDYVFLAADPTGRVAAITRNSAAFDSKDLVVLVTDRDEKEVTGTPYFLKKSKRIAFLATKADKRRPLAWLYARWGKPNESPAFLRFVDNMKERLTVFIDDTALTWPQVHLKRETPYGISNIRLDLSKKFVEHKEDKRPVILFVHGFLGLNSFDGLLTTIPSHEYIAAAMHYGSIPDELPIEEYSEHIVRNINHVAEYFGSHGHPIYIFDHSMGNIYALMIERDFNRLEGIKKYLRGRIGANPFFGEEAKHAMVGFLDNVMLPAVSYSSRPKDKLIFKALRNVMPWDTKKGVRRRGIRLLRWLVKSNSSFSVRVWKSVKKRIMYLMTGMDSLPELNRIPIERALSRLPAKVFAIQIQSSLQESKNFDKMTHFKNMEMNDIPILIIKSEEDVVAKFVERMHRGDNIRIVDVTNKHEKDLFKEHLYHMIYPIEATNLITSFIEETEAKYKE